MDGEERVDMSVLFGYFDRLDARTRPLTPIVRELEQSHMHVETDETCPDEACDGTLWKGPDDKICERCSIVKDGGRDVDIHPNEWQRFWDRRPRYYHSNRRRQVGGFQHEWLDADNAGQPIDLVKPIDFYKA